MQSKVLSGKKSLPQRTTQVYVAVGSVHQHTSNGGDLSIEQIIPKLEYCTKTHNGYEAKCPAHDDERPSLAISSGRDGRILLYCHGGCSLDDVLQALGLEKRDLFPQPQTRSTRTWRREAKYEYLDSNYSVIYRVVRYAGKSGWKVERPDGKAGWLPGLGVADPILFNLPIVQAVVRLRDPESKVYVVEGEKDACNLDAVGLCATTSPFGAGKWRHEYSKELAGAYVVIIPDNDEVGRTHAQQIYDSLQGLAARVVVLELPCIPPSGDVSDWIGIQQEAGLEAPEIRRRLEHMADNLMFWC